jgi:hypothetical protein
MLKKINPQEVAHWAAFTYIAALYFTIVSAQSYLVYVEALYK